jgi:hypothetical protein
MDCHQSMVSHPGNNVPYLVFMAFIITKRELTKLIQEVLMHELAGDLVLRPKEYQATTNEGYEWLESLKRPGRVYRGMTAVEYEATIGSGKPIMSTGRYSSSNEGTNFTDEPITAEGYVNFGRDDPRKTNKSNYLVEVEVTPTMKMERDGYIKSKEPVPNEFVTRIWEMFPKNGAVMVRQIR